MLVRIPNPESLIAVLVLAACVHSTQRYYVPTAGQQRITAGGLRSEGDALMASECPRLMGSSHSAMGEGRLALTIGRDGAVTEARVTKSSGDERVDSIFGSLAAALQFDPPEGMTSNTAVLPARVGYSCAPDAHVITFEIIQPPPPKGASDTTRPPEAPGREGSAAR